MKFKTSYIIQTKPFNSQNDTWYIFTNNSETLEEAQEDIRLFRKTHINHIFRIVKRDYEIIDIVMEE